MTDDPRVYMRLASTLRERIEAGEFKPGCPVPTIGTIREGTGYSRQTIRKAFGVLAGEGLITWILGLGYYVR
jgi:DNA-binding GntR family transcriptional regulator